MSICSCVATPSSSIRSDSSEYGRLQRFTMKPGESAQRMGSRPIVRAAASVPVSASSAACGVATTSTSRIRAGGLKKCIPTMRSGPGRPAAIWPTGSDEVFVARIAAGPQISASRPKSSRFSAEVLRGRLDHELAPLELLQRAGRIDPRGRARSRRPRPKARGRLPWRAPRGPRSTPAASAAAVGVVDGGREASERGNLGDPGPHGPGAHHADAGDCHRSSGPPGGCSPCQ